MLLSSVLDAMGFKVLLWVLQVEITFSFETFVEYRRSARWRKSLRFHIIICTWVSMEVLSSWRWLWWREGGELPLASSPLPSSTRHPCGVCRFLNFCHCLFVCPAGHYQELIFRNSCLPAVSDGQCSKCCRWWALQYGPGLDAICSSTQNHFLAISSLAQCQAYLPFCMSHDVYLWHLSTERALMVMQFSFGACLWSYEIYLFYLFFCSFVHSLSVFRSWEMTATSLPTHPLLS